MAAVLTPPGWTSDCIFGCASQEGEWIKAGNIFFFLSEHVAVFKDLYKDWLFLSLQQLSEAGPTRVIPISWATDNEKE